MNHMEKRRRLGTLRKEIEMGREETISWLDELRHLDGKG